MSLEEREKIFLSFFPKSTIKKLNQKYYDMKERCYNISRKDYDLYGKRGISICKEWLDDKNSFIIWALSNGYNEDCNYSIDRINNNLGYSPENCRFVDLERQNNNRYGVHYETINIDGKDTTLSIKQWSEFFQINYSFMKNIFRTKETRGLGLKGQQVIDYLKSKKKEYIKIY